MKEVFRQRDCEVVIQQNRWNIVISIYDQFGEPERDIVLVASADSGFTDDSGIWFGTQEEYSKREDELLK